MSNKITSSRAKRGAPNQRSNSPEDDALIPGSRHIMHSLLNMPTNIKNLIRGEKKSHTPISSEFILPTNKRLMRNGGAFTPTHGHRLEMRVRIMRLPKIRHGVSSTLEHKLRHNGIGMRHSNDLSELLGPNARREWSLRPLPHAHGLQAFAEA